MHLLIRLYKWLPNVEISTYAITLNNLWDGKIRGNKAGKKYVGNMARIIDWRMADVGLKEIAWKKAEATIAE